MELLLVRHAHAGARGAWPGDDLDRELSEKGRAQAAALAAALSEHDVAAVHSSRAVRCVDTVAPLAAELGLDVVETSQLLEGADPADTLAWLESRQQPIVACSHGDVIGGVVQRLQRRGTPLEGGARWPKASTWRLTVTDGLVTAGRLQTPPDVA